MYAINDVTHYYYNVSQAGNMSIINRMRKRPQWHRVWGTTLISGMLGDTLASCHACWLLTYQQICNVIGHTQLPSSTLMCNYTSCPTVNNPCFTITYIICIQYFTEAWWWWHIDSLFSGVDLDQLLSFSIPATIVS